MTEIFRKYKAELIYFIYFMISVLTLVGSLYIVMDNVYVGVFFVSITVLLLVKLVDSRKKIISIIKTRDNYKKKNK